MVVNVASRIDRLERWRNEIYSPSGGRYVVILAAEPNWPDHQRHVGLAPESDGTPSHLPHWTVSYLVVPSECDSDPVKGLTREQMAWLRSGDSVHVSSRNGGRSGWTGAVHLNINLSGPMIRVFRDR